MVKSNKGSICEFQFKGDEDVQIHRDIIPAVQRLSPYARKMFEVFSAGTIAFEKGDSSDTQIEFRIMDVYNAFGGKISGTQLRKILYELENFKFGKLYIFHRCSISYNRAWIIMNLHRDARYLFIDKTTYIVYNIKDTKALDKRAYNLYLVIKSAQQKDKMSVMLSRNQILGIFGIKDGISNLNLNKEINRVAERISAETDLLLTQDNKITRRVNKCKISWVEKKAGL